MNLNRKIRVGISHGDIDGIGYEVIMKALEDATITELCTPIVYGSAKALAYYRKALDMPSVDFSLIQRAAEALLRLHVADRHDRAPLGRQLCRRHTAARHAQC